MRVAIRILTLSCFVATLTAAVGAQAQTARVVSVVDGDRLVLDDGSRIQLAGIDAPEREVSAKLEAAAAAAGHDSRQEQRFGDVAAAYLAALVRGQHVRIEPSGAEMPAQSDAPDAFAPCIVFVSDPQGTPLFEVNARMLADGYARLDLDHPVPALADYVALYQQARRNGMGLWAASSQAPATLPVAPPSGTGAEAPVPADPSGDSGEIDPLSGCAANPACVWVSADTSGVGGMWQARAGQTCPCAPRQ